MGSEFTTFASAPATHPMTQIGRTAMNVIIKKRVDTDITIIMYVKSDVKETNPFFSSAG
jgi:hypothetical protein